MPLLVRIHALANSFCRNFCSGAILRVTAGIMIFPHGAQKLLGWFSGFGFSGTMNYFTQTMNFPWILGLLIILLEFFGSLFLIAGLGTRVFSSLLIVIMVCAMFMVHLPNGFFMNWDGNQSGEGVEFFILAIGTLMALVISGGGAFSIDKVLFKHG